MVTITNCLLSFCFCYLMGGFIFVSLSPSRQPENMLSRRYLLWSTAGVGVLSFFPILSVILHLSKSMGIWNSFYTVLFTFQSGQAWILTFCISILLFCLIYFNPIEQDLFLAKLSILLVVILIGTDGRSSYLATTMPLTGMIVHFLQLAAISVWGGCLFHASWRTKSDRNWPSFLKWYIPVATSCLIILILLGGIMTFIELSPSFHNTLSVIMINFKNGFVVNFGQALLITSLLIPPLLIFTFFNSLYKRSQLKTDTKRRMRLKSFILLAFILATSYLRQQPPPLNLSQSLQVYGPSPLFKFIYGKNIPNTFTVHLHFGMISFVLGFCSLFLLAMMSLGIFKNRSSYLISILILGYLLSGYLAVIFAIQST